MIGPSIVADDPRANERVLALSTELATLCARIGISYFELAPVLAASPAWTQEALAGDGAHPNRGGYALAADAIARWSSWRAWVER
jgi:lysophospholipase L1-like esterase